MLRVWRYHRSLGFFVKLKGVGAFIGYNGSLGELAGFFLGGLLCKLFDLGMPAPQSKVSSTPGTGCICGRRGASRDRKEEVRGV